MVITTSLTGPADGAVYDDNDDNHEDDGKSYDNGQDENDEVDDRENYDNDWDWYDYDIDSPNFLRRSQQYEDYMDLMIALQNL